MTEKMKPSGIAWIGDIPVGWNVKRVKYVIQNNADGIKVGPFGSALTNEVVSGEDGKYKIYGQANLIRKDFDYGDNFVTEENYRRLINYEVLPDDIAVSMMGTIGKCSVVPHGIMPGIMDSHLIKIRLSNKMNPGFFEYIYESSVVYEQLVVNSKGSIMNGLNSKIVKSVFLAVPPFDEQIAITNFLDAQCAKIDSVIADIEKQIETLQKYKKALITEAVTKGLNRSVPMKDSGIKDINDIPQNWNVQRLKYVSWLKTGTTPAGNEGVNYDEQGTPWFTPADFNPLLVLEKSEKFIDEETIHRENITPYPAGSVLLVAIGATVGKIGITQTKGYSNQQITAIIPVKINSKYLLYYLYSKADYIKDNALYTTLPIINNAYLSNIPVTIPSDQEQLEIAEFLDRKCSLISEIIREKEEQLSAIQQHKKSLIYEYVTGKKRVVEES